jgi:UPF0755 protein
VKLLRWSFALLILLVAAAGYAVWELNQPYAAFREETFIEFSRGTSTMGMARMLADAGVIPHAWEFVAVRGLHPRRTLQAGEYRFDRPASVLDVYDRIARGDVFYYVLTIPEGQNMFDIAAAADKLKLFSASDFLRAARDTSSIHDLDPAAPTLEGYLFPSTYHLVRHTTPARLCQMMITRFREEWKQLDTSRDVHRSVTLASLIEREAHVSVDRPLISSVFQNRLKIGMKLDCDPTTIYAALLDGRYRGAIHKSDLASANPYNTYRNSGLPPGPIANPGRDSLLAAVHPADTQYLYFVLRPDGSGAHNFSKTISEHLIATTQYRRASQREQLEESAPTPIPRRKKAHSSN